MADLREAYRFAREVEPTDRTIHRNILRINELFYPYLQGGRKVKKIRGSQARKDG